ncbi:MAG TPA: STAS domain-containing protein [bacterium]|nr:STAS domain-containing protein [bacterium]
MRDLVVEAKNIKNGIMLKLKGELMFVDAQEFMLKTPERVKGKGKNVVLDMDDLRFIDSSGLGSMLYVSQACKMQDQTMYIVRANDKVAKSLKTIKKVGTFELHDPVVE